ncbi:hypothetical protein LTR70_001219 [Exophiala xenobiotica]|uniref:Uncharacterized protein n=1 Tax=Lithohypha guttulata TaxID=1690604 RepID=A0ABR0KKN4_9EURO|nr:hypothetical protein LTR24_001470 [Lithohypha guttulata]KAK5328194.1 hypothetical protein LTR70_001219 [Exophiala xenobiotica]
METQTFLVIDSSTVGQTVGRTRLRNASCEQIRGLADGYPVGLYMNDSNNQATKIWSRKISLKALCSLSPAIARALSEHNSTRKTSITDLLLPAALAEAYQKVFEWFQRVLTSEALVPLARLESFAIYKYYHILIVSTILEIDYITNDLNKRYKRMLTVTPPRYFSIDPDTIRQAYRNQDTNETLRNDIIGAVAFAQSNNLLKYCKYKELNDLKKELPDFGKDLDACIKGLEL